MKRKKNTHLKINSKPTQVKNYLFKILRRKILEDKSIGIMKNHR